jgi:hypothetical protein
MTDTQASWREGAVDPAQTHIRLSYGPAEGPFVPVARLSPAAPGSREFIVEFLTPAEGMVLPDDARDKVRAELDFYLVDKRERDPWAYAIYHCGTAASLYSDVHWGYFPERHASDSTPG